MKKALFIALFLNALSRLYATEIKLYPNPTEGIVNIEIAHQSKSGKILFYNFIGEQIGEQIIIPNQSMYHFNLFEYPVGTYFANVRYNNGQSQTIKFSKTNP